jgi:hypothetical protein
MSRKKFKFEHLPILIGDKAIELHKLRLPPITEQPNEINQLAPITLLVSIKDYNSLKENYGSSEVSTAWCKYLVDENNNNYYVNWYNFTYDTVLPNAVKIKTKLVVDKQTLLFMLLLPAFDKKNKITRNIAKKYLEDTMIVANSFIG